MNVKGRWRPGDLCICSDEQLWFVVKIDRLPLGWPGFTPTGISVSYQWLHEGRLFQIVPESVLQPEPGMFEPLNWTCVSQY